MNQIKKKIEEILRVDHAGEYGAVRIYHGQLKSFAKRNNFEILPIIEEMKQQEIQHLKFFNKALIEKEVVGTVFLPIWHVFGYGLGYMSAALGDDFAMTCTEAVEETINEHYLSQIEFLKNNNNPSNEQSYVGLEEKLEQFRLEELQHKDHATNHNYNSGLNSKPIRKKLNKCFSTAVKIGCKIAISMSKKF